MMPVSRSDPASPFTIAPIEGWEVRPEKESKQQSMISAPEETREREEKERVAVGMRG